jgi:hypothetical protein
MNIKAKMKQAIIKGIYINLNFRILDFKKRRAVSFARRVPSLKIVLYGLTEPVADRN